MKMEDQWRIAAYHPEWKSLFSDTASRLKRSLGDLAVRIDHVGSTAVAGLDAKPVIDIQISVADLDDAAAYKAPVESAGFILRADNPDLTKKYFREIPGARRTHIHVRQAGSYSEQVTLLFRDFLREHPNDCKRYAIEKRRLMALFPKDRTGYVEGKGPVVWELLQKAHRWSQAEGWKPGRPDF
jgi:GrpB-like predicted nucleotidyltransferase (UPF0157 family)